VTSYTDPGFGHFLSNDADLLSACRRQTGAYLADLPRVVDLWRRPGARPGAMARDQFSPAEAEQWLRRQPGAGPREIDEFRALAALWMRQVRPGRSGTRAGG
jgi:hypothetical protein